MGTTDLSLVSGSGAGAAFAGLVVVYCVLALGVIAATFWLCRADDNNERPSSGRRTPSWRRVTLHPVMLTEDHGSIVLDGVLAAQPGAVGLPVAFELESPESALVAAVVHDVLDRWTTDDREIELDLSRVALSHPTIGLSSGDTIVRLDLARVTPELWASRRPSHPSQ